MMNKTTWVWTHAYKKRITTTKNIKNPRIITYQNWFKYYFKLIIYSSSKSNIGQNTTLKIGSESERILNLKLPGSA